MDGYWVPKGEASVETIVANSRFIAIGSHVATVEDARAFIQRVRHTHPNANHHVYAYRIGAPPSVIDGMSDDGEPSGTSGPPTLAVLRGSGLGDVVIVTTRYFGGTLLGTGGLTRAYSDAARAIIAALSREMKIEKASYLFEVPYALYELTKRLLPRFDALIVSESFEGAIVIETELPKMNGAAFCAAMIEMSSGAIHPLAMS